MGFPLSYKIAEIVRVKNKQILVNIKLFFYFFSAQHQIQIVTKDCLSSQACEPLPEVNTQ